MPYIKESLREGAFDEGTTPGELNYSFTQMALAYIRRTKEDYQHYNDVIGALEACKLEFYRRLVAPYEDKKIEENGDVFT